MQYERDRVRQQGGRPQRMWLLACHTVGEGTRQTISSLSSLCCHEWVKSWNATRRGHQRNSIWDSATKIHPDIFTLINRWSHNTVLKFFVLTLLFPAQVTDDYSVIGRNLFKKETNLQLFLGLKVVLSTGETGVVEGGFGQSGKFKIRIQGKVHLRWDVTASSPLFHHDQNQRCCVTPIKLPVAFRKVASPRLQQIHTSRALSRSGLCGPFSGCGNSGRPDILSHIPRIPLGIACVPGEVCSLFILPSVAPSPLLHTGREEKTKTFRKRTSPTSSSFSKVWDTVTHTSPGIQTFSGFHLTL